LKWQEIIKAASRQLPATSIVTIALFFLVYLKSIEKIQNIFF
jgi:hypothetical protein